jgi:hypothetical protein
LHGGPSRSQLNRRYPEGGLTLVFPPMMKLKVENPHIKCEF